MTPSGAVAEPTDATTEGLRALYNAMSEHLRPTILLGAFVGLRLAETCGPRIGDVEFMREVVHRPCSI